MTQDVIAAMDCSCRIDIDSTGEERFVYAVVGIGIVDATRKVAFGAMGVLVDRPIVEGVIEVVAVMGELVFYFIVKEVGVGNALETKSLVGVAVFVDVDAHQHHGRASVEQPLDIGDVGIGELAVAGHYQHIVAAAVGYGFAQRGSRSLIPPRHSLHHHAVEDEAAEWVLVFVGKGGRPHEARGSDEQYGEETHDQDDYPHDVARGDFHASPPSSQSAGQMAR